MLLSVRFLNDVGSANSYEIIDNPEFFAGDAQTIHIQLIDASLDRDGQGFNPPGRRYLPPAGSTLTVTMLSTDSAKQLVRTASQPFPLDGSIWSFPVLASDPIAGTVRIKVSLTEPGPRTLHTQFLPGSYLKVR